MSLAVGTVIGCGGDNRDLFEVQGTITLDGQPLAAATIEFSPVAGKKKGSRGRTDSSGRYEMIYLRNVRGAVAGKHMVSIRTATEQAPKEKLPDRYHRATELVAEVESQRNTIDFKLTAK